MLMFIPKMAILLFLLFYCLLVLSSDSSSDEESHGEDISEDEGEDTSEDEGEDTSKADEANVDKTVYDKDTIDANKEEIGEKKHGKCSEIWLLRCAHNF